MGAASMGGLGLGLGAGGSMLSAGGAIASGFANKSMYDYQSAVAKLRGQIADQNAEFAIQTGEQQAVKTGMAQAARFGQMKTAQAAGGFDVNSGTNLQVQKSQRMLDTMDLEQIRSNASKAAYGYKIEGVMDRSQADVYSAAGKDAAMGGVISGFGSILGGAGSVSSMWMQGGKVGLWNGTALAGGGGSGGDNAWT